MCVESGEEKKSFVRKKKWGKMGQQMSFISFHYIRWHRWKLFHHKINKKKCNNFTFLITFLWYFFSLFELHRWWMKSLNFKWTLSRINKLLKIKLFLIMFSRGIYDNSIDVYKKLVKWVSTLQLCHHNFCPTFACVIVVKKFASHEKVLSWSFKVFFKQKKILALLESF